MRLSEQCGLLQSKLDERRRHHALSRQGAVLQTRRRKVEEVLRLALGPFQSWKVLVESGIVVDYPRDRAAELHTKAMAVRKKFRENRASLIDEDDINQVLAELKAICERLEDRITPAWTRYVDERSIGIDDQLLGTLRAIPELEQRLQEIRQLRASIQRLRSSPPKSGEEVQELTQLATELRSKWSQLSSDQLPEEVVTFLRHAGGRGAPLDLLTPTVLSWLQERRLGASFHVVPRDHR